METEKGLVVARSWEMGCTKGSVIIKGDLGGDELVLYFIDGGYTNLHMDKIA